ncbi:MAG: M16 family metallopeptidase [Saprospiraceae bacterium]|jgi:predicted Zn-dependent peptidase
MPPKAPRIYAIQPPTFPAPKNFVLSNGLKVFLIEGGSQELIKLEIIFNSGRPYESRPLVGRVTNSLLIEGSDPITGSDLAEKLDFFGTSLELPFNLDTGRISIYLLSKHLKEVLKLIGKIFQKPAFPIKELDAYKNRNQAKLKEDLEKIDVLAYRRITELVFGKKHPYGYNSSEEKYRKINRDDLIEHFDKWYRAENATLILSGKFPANTRDILEATLGQAIPNGFSGEQPKIKKDSLLPFGIYPMETENNQQTAIRVGGNMFNKSHPEYVGLFVLTTVLGGYFGSRLMGNLREDYGLTYNVYAHLETFRYGGFFGIGTEVSKGKEEQAIQSIYHEVKKLKEKLISNEELKMVKNYLSGSFLNLIDGPFNQASALRELVIEDLPLDYFEKENEIIRSITSQNLRELANKYLNLDKMYWAIIGNTNYR